MVKPGNSKCPTITLDVASQGELRRFDSTPKLGRVGISEITATGRHHRAPVDSQSAPRVQEPASCVSLGDLNELIDGS